MSLLPPDRNLSDQDTGGLNSESITYARRLDEDDKLKHLRQEFFIPDRTTFGKKIDTPQSSSKDRLIYFAGAGMGLQPRSVLPRIQTFLNQWASQAAFATFGNVPNSEFPSWLEAENVAASLIAGIVGAKHDEVVCMGSVTSNLHLLLASFYGPSWKEKKHDDNGARVGRTKILIEEGAFSSDIYAIESHLRSHNIDPSQALVRIPVDSNSRLLTTTAICSAIDFHSSTAAILLLPGVQFQTGQLLDIPDITAYAQEKGILVGWDLAHAVGNVELKLHDWNVDFAVWCSYKYLNAGPGSTGGIFVNERHTRVDESANNLEGDRYRKRLAGWWGTPLSQRFDMNASFKPASGAAGFQLSSPSILDLTALTASLKIFNTAGMQAIVRKSRQLTGYLEMLLRELFNRTSDSPTPCYIVTPKDPEQRGAMLCLHWREPHFLERVVQRLKEEGIIVDLRKPDVMRITPIALYNTFEDVWTFVQRLGNIMEE